MIVGFCGSGNMAAAMARGLRGEVEGMLFTDSGSGRAAELAEELGGEALSSNADLAKGSDIVVLAVKPARLGDAAGELGGAKTVVSLLGATSLDDVSAVFPGSRVVRVMPNVGVEVRRGVLCVAGEPDAEVRTLLERLGQVVELPDSQFDAATAVMGCAPAY
ncbi:MAG: pyrroline-5-carboxylate reductase family protein, partial [Solirubrobacterales bacterium]